MLRFAQHDDVKKSAGLNAHHYKAHRASEPQDRTNGDRLPGQLERAEGVRYERLGVGRRRSREDGSEGVW
jgi:hypothetical protein